MGGFGSACLSVVLALVQGAANPLPEHPRPDFQRAQWLNLNSRWQFAFDPHDSGEPQGWPSRGIPVGRDILVPFSWGSPLSGVPDSADIGWYGRDITVPNAWRGRRVFLVFGASDWRDRKSTRLNSSHLVISYAVFCLKKKKKR